LSQDHIQGLQEAVQPGRLWEAPFGFVPPPQGLPDYVAPALAEADHRNLSLPDGSRMIMWGGSVVVTPEGAKRLGTRPAPLVKS
jgi:hypothetical protein